ncbi:GNAT family N-acetyltransferase [Cyclobacterium salsum]|uniref:GNAT family N-acetyltransferase n=1 Tax=Cyclobacterium salsum TaxID=2666329 RepID=UPI00139144AB|nr:GNAT family N-acetyltransferase [Cyclobacterium salsum]
MKTERLELAPFKRSDEMLFLALNTNPYVRKYLWDDQVIDAKTASEILCQNETHFEQDKYGLWKIHLKQNGGLIGYVGLWFFFNEEQPQLIYALLEGFTKQGYAQEASASIIEYAFKKLDFNYLIAATDEPHIESQKVAKKLGMSFIEKRYEDEKATLFFRLDKH